MSTPAKPNATADKAAAASKPAPAKAGASATSGAAGKPAKSRYEHEEGTSAITKQVRTGWL